HFSGSSIMRMVLFAPSFLCVLVSACGGGSGSNSGASSPQLTETQTPSYFYFNQNEWTGQDFSELRLWRYDVANQIAEDVSSIFGGVDIVKDRRQVVMQLPGVLVDDGEELKLFSHHGLEPV